MLVTIFLAGLNIINVHFFQENTLLGSLESSTWILMLILQNS